MTLTERLTLVEIEEYLDECAARRAGRIAVALPHLAEEEREIDRLIAEHRWAE